MHRLWARILISVSAGLLTVLVCYFFQTHWLDRDAVDLTWALLGARGWLAGKNPYNLQSDPSLYPYDQGTPLFYPFTAVLATLPLAPLPDSLAATLWIGLTVGLMTYALLGECAWRLLILASLPLFLFKPNIGLALSTKKLFPKGDYRLPGRYGPQPDTAAHLAGRLASVGASQHAASHPYSLWAWAVALVGPDALASARSAPVVGFSLHAATDGILRSTAPDARRSQFAPATDPRPLLLAFHDRVAPDWPLLELALDLASAMRRWQRRLGDPFTYGTALWIILMKDK